MEKKKSSSGVIAVAALFLVFALLLVGMNVLTAPAIAKSGSAALLAPLFEVLPEAGGFEALYDAATGEGSLANVPETVKAVYAENSGLGYAVSLSTTKGYTGDAITMTLGVDGEGKISGLTLNSFPDTKSVDDFPMSFVGQDSALAGVSLVSGATYSSAAIRDAVTDGMNVLIENGLIGAGVKGDEQILIELLPSLYSGIANSSGVLQAEEPETVEGCSYITRVLKATNGSGFAFIVKEGDTTLLAVCNPDGGTLYDTEGNEAQNDAALAECLDYAKANAEDFGDTDLKKLTAMLEADETERISLDGVYGTVTTAYLMKSGDAAYYGIAARSYAYSNQPIAIYYILDENGAIVSMNATELILFGEYFTSYELDEASYKQGFEGLTAETYTGEQALVTGATMTTDAVNAATTDVFAAFPILKANGGDNA